MSHCKKFTPNIFNKIKCSNCFRQKEEHSAEALECNRACRSIARSGYLFVAPDWDFSVPLNRTKRWQRRWFVLYDDGELNYSVDEHPDTVPQGSVDMTKVLEVTGAEQVTGHPHSLALTGPDRVTFVKATSREETRWWAELLAVFPRRHKRNATFPGGRASPSLPQLGRSASPQPPRPRHLSCTGPSPRTNFTTPPLKEERESPAKEEVRMCRHDNLPTVPLLIEQTTPSPRNDYVVSSGSPPTRDKLRCEDKARARQDWRNERLRDIATALTDRSPESSLALPAEGLLNLKKGWLWFQHSPNEWMKLWWVLCEPTLTAYEKEQDEQGIPLISVELSSVTNCCEIQTDTRYGFQIHWSGPVLILSAVTEGIRSNWLKALKRATPTIERNLPSPSSAPATPRSALLSSDEEYRTASEGGRRDSEDWGDYNPTSPVPKTLMTRMKDRARLRPKLPRCHSRQSTLDSVSTDELDGFKDEDNTKQSIELNELKRQLSIATTDVQNLEAEVVRLKNLQAETHDREKQARERLTALERTEKELSQKIRLSDDKYNHEQITWQRRISDYERSSRESEDRCSSLSRELQAKQRIVASLQEELNCVNERLTQTRIDNDRLYKKLQEIEGKNIGRSKRMASLTDLTDIDLEIDLETLNQNELIEQCLDLRSRFEKAVVEIRAVKRELRESHVKYDELELQNVTLKRSLEMVEQESQAHATLMADRVQDLTNKLAAVEKQARTLKSKLQDSREKRRSLSLKGRENFSINKEVEDKVTELEAKILSLERGRSRRKHRRDRSVENASPIDDKTLRRLRRKSLDSATSSEPMKLLMRLTTLESKVNQVNTSNESLTQNSSVNELNKTDDFTNNLTAEDIIKLAKEKVGECQQNLGLLRSKKRAPSPSVDRYAMLETGLVELGDILGMKITGTEYNVVNASVKGVVKQLEGMLREKLLALEEKKNSLRENGRLDQKNKMEIFAEKIAYENLIIGRIEEAIKFHCNTDTNCDRLFGKETIETANLIAKLQSKLTDGATKENPTLMSSLDHLTKVLTKRLLYQSHNLTYPPKNPVKNLSLTINYLEEEQNKLTSTLNLYKTEKLPLLADALALETLCLSMDESCRLQENTISDTWCAAREIVNSELITSEINHVLMRTAQNYETTSSSDQSFFFTFFAFDRAVLELWSDSVENTLRSEMERYIDELNDLYRNSLTKLQRQNWRRKLENERSNRNHTVLLKEYADVIAHKSLIDARISVLRGECVESSSENRGDNNYVMNLFELESYWDCMQNLGLVDVSRSLEAEFKMIMDRTTCEARNDVFYDQDFRRMRTAVANLYSEIKELRGAIGASVDENDNSLLYSMDDICMKCREMRRLVKEVKENVADLQNKSDLSDNNRVPLYLGTEYLNQVENLRAAYRKTLSECESHKQQVDLEELQILCERVLVAMEHWHRRTLQDLRETHSKELHALRQDKEQALAEETQATLAALDAMRKAHEAEVQREVARFKQDFAREQQNELQELNEQLSVKCLEAAALQEQLGSATRQLSHAQQHILQLQRNSHISTQN